jgi:hypothetical protein
MLVMEATAEVSTTTHLTLRARRSEQYSFNGRVFEAIRQDT